MLVLTRKLGETIYIGDNIMVTVAEIRGRTVRLAVQAPPEVPVDRTEVRERRQALLGEEVLAGPRGKLNGCHQG